jgi:hypothetical protein
VQRITRAITELKAKEGVDVDNIGVIGYCFGGTGVIQLAFSGNTEAKIVVSFHGGLTELPDVSADIFPYTLIASGGIDDAHGNQTELEAALNSGNANWEITRYSGVDHGFTDWQSDAYSVSADVRSWEAMMTAMKELGLAPQLSSDGTSDQPSVVPGGIESIQPTPSTVQSTIPSIVPGGIGSIQPTPSAQPATSSSTPSLGALLSSSVGIIVTVVAALLA